MTDQNRTEITLPGSISAFLENGMLKEIHIKFNDPSFEIQTDFNERMLKELSEAYDSVTRLLSIAFADLKNTGRRTDTSGQGMQTAILMERKDEINKEIEKISPVKNFQDMCASCRFSFENCQSTSAVFGIDRNKNLRGTEADKVIQCGQHEQKGF